MAWQAKLVGAKAKNLLAMPGFSGKVLAVLSQAIYLMGGDGEILWLSREDLPLHRRCLTAPFQPDGVRPGQTFITQGPNLRINGHVAIHFEQAIEWEAPLKGAGNTVPLRVMKDTLRTLLAAFPTPAHPTIGREGTAENFFFQRILSLIFSIKSACCKRDMSQVIKIGKELIGLGPGLTPSGDDFLGGIFFAAHSLQAAYPEVFHWKEQAIIDLIEWARPQTNPISHTILSDLALGHGPEPLHNLLAGLLQGQDLNQLLPDARRMLTIGHTSGWEILAGALTGLLFIQIH